MTLATSQTRFLDLILNDAPPPLTPGEAVYHFAYRSRLLEALRDTYGRVWSWLGDDAFDAAGRTYIRTHPPSSWTLDAVGLGFDATLAALYPDDPEVPELAWLDWTLRQAFSAADTPVIDPAALANADWSVARLRLASGFRHRPLSTNSVAIWQALSRGETPPPVQTLREAAGLIVWRNGLEPVFRTLETDEYGAIVRLEHGASFASVCADLDGPYPETDSTLTASKWLGQWISGGLICDIY
ncbi:DNA-binding domain-containing protein [Asticcacaulis sp. 201]|uniref:DNA-binding domain-containing protein n=1 Tax=Asticcacaulis sp. 201 TaxID=3028787 RepID=UPI002915F1A4|nr:DNA-binding domain-containing protein [Asticcacaulis sp. 201]MDV6332888.1 DNA-binding domain-containing protein [Asticcacaulis sp. 201]